MARLPTPGGDNGNWGTILNDYLAQSHKPDGTIKDNAVTNDAIAPDAVTGAEIADGTIQEAQLASEVQTKLNQAAPTWNTIDEKPAVVAAGSDVTAARSAIGAASATDVVNKPVTRIGMKTLSAPNNSSAASTLNLTQRTVVQLPFRAPRWRIGFRNKQLRSTTVYTTPCTITGLWVGEPARDTGSYTGMRWNGNTVATPVQVSSSLAVPTDGSRVWSDWIDGAAFEAGVDKVLSWGLTSTNTGNGYASGNSLQGVSASGANQASSAVLTSPTIAINAIRLDVIMEYEFAEPVRHVLYLGDSNTISYSSGRLPIPATYSGNTMSGLPPGALPSETWPAMAGAMTGSSEINLGVGSATLADFNVSSSSLTQLWDRIPSGAVIDLAIVSLGVNGIAAGPSGFVPHFQAINSYLRNTLGVGRIWWTTITPGGYSDRFARLTSACSAGAVNVTMDASPAVGTVLIGSGHTSEEVTVSSVSGSGPYTATLSTGIVYDHTATEPVSWERERSRRVVNAILRQLPDGISGCVDFERILEASHDSPVGDPRYVDADGLHWNRGASIEKARAVAALSAQPLIS